MKKERKIKTAEEKLSEEENLRQEKIKEIGSFIRVCDYLPRTY